MINDIGVFPLVVVGDVGTLRGLTPLIQLIVEIGVIGCDYESPASARWAKTLYVGGTPDEHCPESMSTELTGGNPAGSRIA
ncbi:hypothetical protein [Dyella solisilvae]|uniref:hypothetical protein n=1 Tax=Dyella solisilvae TaxID=1920168 RepID=UPI0011C01D64|nr:hypothetical protein [Dyella solisilvae]